MCIRDSLIAGYDTLLTAIRNICHGQVFDENFLMAIATIGAIGLKDYKEAVFVMLFYLVGTIFEEYAVNKSRGSISELMDIRPDYANQMCIRDRCNGSCHAHRLCDSGNAGRFVRIQDLSLIHICQIITPQNPRKTTLATRFRTCLLYTSRCV